MRLLWAVTHGLESASARMLATVGVTGPQRLVLRLIGRSGQAIPGDLAETLHVHPSSLTGVLRRLEASGLIRRRRDPNDGRRAILTLTPSGQRLNDRRAGTIEAVVQGTLAAFPEAKIASVRELLGALASALGVDDGSGALSVGEAPGRKPKPAKSPSRRRTRR